MPMSKLCLEGLESGLPRTGTTIEENFFHSCFSKYGKKTKDLEEFAISPGYWTKGYDVTTFPTMEYLIIVAMIVRVPQFPWKIFIHGAYVQQSGINFHHNIACLVKHPISGRGQSVL